MPSYAYSAYVSWQRCHVARCVLYAIEANRAILCGSEDNAQEPELLPDPPTLFDGGTNSKK